MYFSYSLTMRIKTQATTKTYLRPHFEVYQLTMDVLTQHVEVDMRGHRWGLLPSSPGPLPQQHLRTAPSPGRHRCVPTAGHLSAQHSTKISI